MSNYRRKPIVVEAEQLDDSPLSVERIMSMATSGSIKIICEHDGGESHLLRIRTLDGEMIARPGDYVIKGVQGGLYTCKSDIFAATYEAVEADV